MQREENGNREEQAVNVQTFRLLVAVEDDYEKQSVAAGSCVENVADKAYFVQHAGHPCRSIDMPAAKSRFKFN